MSIDCSLELLDFLAWSTLFFFFFNLWHYTDHAKGQALDLTMNCLRVLHPLNEPGKQVDLRLNN